MSREYIENRENQVVNNKAQYCSVVRTGIGKTVLCLGGEVDASMLHLTNQHLVIASNIAYYSMGLQAGGEGQPHQLGRAQDVR